VLGHAVEEAGADNRLRAPPRSGAVSARVPSRSKRTASGTALCPQQVIDVGIGADHALACEGVVTQAGDLEYFQPGVAAKLGKFRRLEEAGVVVGAARQ
jgi:hypothetical protein